MAITFVAVSVREGLNKNKLSNTILKIVIGILQQFSLSLNRSRGTRPCLVTVFFTIQEWEQRTESLSDK